MSLDVRSDLPEPAVPVTKIVSKYS
jgi:hypothetical protein